DPADNLRAQARRHRHQRHRRRPGRSDRHHIELRLSGVSGPLECGLRHNGGGSLPCHHHHIHHAALEDGEPLCAEDDLTAREKIARDGERAVTTAIAEPPAAGRQIEAGSLASWVARFGGKTIVYALLILWTVIALFPIYWTLSTSLKLGRDVTQGHLIPWVDFMPSWRGWQSLGFSPDTIFTTSDVRDEFLKKFVNSVICSIGASALAVMIGSLAAYGLSRFDYKFGFWRNKDILFFFVSQLIIPPVVLALPFLVLYKELALLDTRIGLILVYTLMVLPIVIWVMRDQFDTIPPEMEQAAMVDGCSIWGAFMRIVLPMALPGMVAAFILSLVLCWNEYFFASFLTGFDAQTLPVMVASQTGSQGINWWTIGALATAAITPLLLVGIFLERYIVMGLTAGAGK